MVCTQRHDVWGQLRLLSKLSLYAQHREDITYCRITLSGTVHQSRQSHYALVVVAVLLS